MNRRSAHILLIGIVALLAYSNTFFVPFHYDDHPNIVENPIIRHLGYFAEPSKAQGLYLYHSFVSRYLGYLSFALNYAAHGLDVTGYHVVNLLIHILNALLVYHLVQLTMKAPFIASRLNAAEELNGPIPARNIALFSALLFVSHPVQTQAVTYIVQRFASLATLFYLFSLVLYIQWRMASFPVQGSERQAPPSPPAARLTSALWYLASLFSAVLAMKTKEIAFTLPFVIVLYEFLFFSGKRAARMLFLVPILLTLLIIPLSLLELDKPIGSILTDLDGSAGLQPVMPRMDYLFTQFRVIVTYVRLLLFPVRQSLDYDYPMFHSFFDPEVLLSFLLLNLILALGVYLFYRSRRTSPLVRIAAFGIFWFFLTFSVESSIPLADVIFEHRLYLPSVGFFIAIAVAGAIGIKRARANRTGAVLVPAFLLVIALFAGAAYSRNRVWQDVEAVWNDVVQKHPGNARAHCYLGEIYEENGRIDKAIEQYAIALGLKPRYGEAHSNLGGAYLASGRTDNAIEQFRIALTLDPLNSTPEYYYGVVNQNLGIAYAHKGDFERAREYFQEARKFNQSAVTIYYRIGATYAAQGNSDAAEGYFQMAKKIMPDYLDVHRDLGRVYFESGLMDQARTEFEAVLLAAPNDAEARRTLELIPAR